MSEEQASSHRSLPVKCIVERTTFARLLDETVGAAGERLIESLSRPAGARGESVTVTASRGLLDLLDREVAPTLGMLGDADRLASISPIQQDFFDELWACCNLPVHRLADASTVLPDAFVRAVARNALASKVELAAHGTLQDADRVLAVYAEVRLPRPQPGLVRSEVPGLAQALTWIASGIVGNAAWHLVLKYLRDQGRSEEQPAVSPLRVDDAVAFGRQYSISIGGERSDEDLMLRSVSRERVDGEWVWCCVLETPVQTFRIVMLDLGQGIPVLRDFEIVNRIEVGEEWDPPAGG